MATLKVKKAEAIELLVALGFKAAKGKKADWLLNRFQEIPDLMEDDGDELELTDAQRALAEGIAEAVDDEEDILITEDKDNSKAKKSKGKAKAKKETKAKGKAKKETKAKAKKETKGKDKAKAKGKDKAKAKKDIAGIGKDKFGSRIGTKAAAMNKCVTKKAKSMATLLEEAGLESTLYNHMNKMVDEGHFVRTDDKEYKLA